MSRLSLDMTKLMPRHRESPGAVSGRTREKRSLPGELFCHRDGIDLDGRFTADFRSACDSSWNLFVAFLGFGFGHLLLRD